MALNDEATLYLPQRTSASAYRMPTPPRIVVPPPSLDGNALPDITICASKSDTFISNIDYSNIITQNALLEWTYERRREAQLILPYLFLGPMRSAKDEQFLTSHGITCLLGVRQKGAFETRLMDGAVRKARERDIETQTVDLSSNQDLIQAFPQTSKFIYDHVAGHHQATGQMGKVLVFCESGNERGAGVVAAYLMDMYEDVDYIKAMQFVQAQRFCVNFDDGLKRLLQGYWDILCARRGVESTNVTGASAGGANGNGVGMQQQVGSARAKRTHERDDDDDVMDDAAEDDKERFSGRSFAPFAEQSI